MSNWMSSPACAPLSAVSWSMRVSRKCGEPSIFFTRSIGVLPRVARHHQIDLQPLLDRQLGANGYNMQPRRHHSFQVFENFSPGKRLALEEFVEESEGSRIIRLLGG